MIGLLDLSSDQRRALLGIAELCLGRFSKPPRKWISHREQADGPCFLPKLRAARDRARADFLVSVAAGVRAYSSQVAWERCERELQTAEWRLACESWQWARKITVFDESWYWNVGNVLAAFRYINRDHLLPGNSLAVRSKGAVSK